MTNASSALANLSSYKKISNDDCNSNTTAMAATTTKALVPKALIANGAHKPSMPVVTVTVSPAGNQKPPASLSHARESIANTIAPSATKQQQKQQHNDTQQKTMPQTPTSTDTKWKNPQNVSVNDTLMQPPRSLASAKKKINANILFETVKMSKQSGNNDDVDSAAAAATSSPSTPSTRGITATAQSSSISMNGSLGYSKISPISSGNHIKSVVTKNDMDKNINNERMSGTNEKITSQPSSIQNVMDNELIDVRHSLESNSSESGNAAAAAPLSNNRMKSISMNVMPQITSAAKHFSTSNDAESTVKPMNILATVSHQAASIHQKYYKQINDNGINVFAPRKNINALETDVLSIDDDDVDISANIVCNNNLDYNLDECMQQMNSASDNPFKIATTAGSKFVAVDLLAHAATESNSKTVENIYANCVMMPMNSANLDNYQQQKHHRLQQQDTNENVIAVGGVDVATADGSNNNYSSSSSCVNFMNSDSSNICSNNNALIKIDQQNISNGDNYDNDNGDVDDDDNDDGRVDKNDGKTATVSHTTSESPNKPTHTISSSTLSSFNQNCFTPKSYEMYDILEESDDDEHSNLFRFSRWNSSCSLFVPKSQVSVSSSSFAAAIAFAHEMDSTNRNPFLQLIAVSQGSGNVETASVDAANASETQTITTTSTKSPIVITGSDSQFHLERQKNSIGIAAPLISSAFNNNDQSDVCMAFTSTDKFLTSSTLSISNCANAWNDFAAMPSASPPPPLPHSVSSSSLSMLLLSPPHESQSSSQINGFIEQNDFQLNNDAIASASNSTANAQNHISSDVMDTMLLFLKENGNQYIKQFMQVI